jgi:hypothetical protein
MMKVGMRDGRRQQDLVIKLDMLGHCTEYQKMGRPVGYLGGL